MTYFDVCNLNSYFINYHCLYLIRSLSNLIVYLMLTGTSNPNSPSIPPLPTATTLCTGGIHHPMPGTQRLWGGDALHRPILGGGRCWGDKRVIANPWRRAIWWEHSPRKDNEINLLQLLCVLPLRWWPPCNHVCCVDWRQQGLEMGFLHLHLGHFALYPCLPGWIHIL